MRNSAYAAAAEGKFKQRVTRVSCAFDSFCHLFSVAAELLTQTDRRRVHQMSPPRFDNRIELGGFGGQRFVQARKRRNQFIGDGRRRCHVNCCRNHVVR